MFDLFRSIPHRPHPGQTQFHAADTRFKLLVAGARFGKSLAQAREVALDSACAPLRGWMVAPTYALTAPEFRYLSQSTRGLGQLADLHDGGRRGHSNLATRAGGDIHALSAREPAGLLGEELDWLLLCEAANLDRDDWERILRPRLATRLGRMVAGSTPRGSNWFHDLALQAASNTDWSVFRYATWDNPLIPAEEIESLRKSLPADVFDEQFGGEFSARQGRVFPEFSLALHGSQLLAPPPGSVIHKGIDFGFTRPFACLWLAQDGQGRVSVLAEFYRPGLTVNAIVPELIRVDDGFRAKGYAIGTGWADPSGAEFIATLQAAGLALQKADNNLLAGIDVVRTALKVRPDGTPGLRIDARCANLLREIENYRWEEQVGRGERVPEKKDDHALDALRYALVGLQRRVGWQQGPRLC